MNALEVAMLVMIFCIMIEILYLIIVSPVEFLYELKQIRRLVGELDKIDLTVDMEDRVVTVKNSKGMITHSVNIKGNGYKNKRDYDEVKLDKPVSPPAQPIKHNFIPQERPSFVPKARTWVGAESVAVHCCKYCKCEKEG